MELWRFKDGATDHLEKAGYGVDGNIDGLVGYQIGNYSHIKEYPHVGIVIINSTLGFGEVGIARCWLEPFEGY